MNAAHFVGGTTIGAAILAIIFIAIWLVDDEGKFWLWCSIAALVVAYACVLTIMALPSI